jgi:hypothetical protein
MRSRIILFSLFVSGAALAAPQRMPVAPASNAALKAPMSNLPPINLDEVPEQCKTIAKQASAVNVVAALSARISLANCLADTKLAKLQLLDCEESILAVDEATAMSFDLLDGVIAGATDETTRIVAHQAKAELYASMVTRMMTTLPPPGTTESSIAMHTARKGILELLVVKWKDAGAKSYEAILATVKAKPALEKNPVVRTAVATAKDRLRLHVASAPQPEAPPAPAPADEKAPKTDTGEQLR